ncbi:bifunctional 4-hydroxy-2-oxoglutarate aldolase/2-dehydro-3-deoxy-phosphogluconate aldolase [Oscillospiraceae bacterium LTW-04]|nr:bifunctional 4-hydroxy-2-oxoglutarate aldolase/2-dehydro-3-deoxy-phosphogluconate aldolase [Oscillospiraceae bacterium MB24-C1]
MTETTLQTILESKVIAIVRGISAQGVCELAQAMKQGGLRCIEVTFDHTSEAARQETLKSICAIKAQFGHEMCIGAGTVLSVEDVGEAQRAGAEYIISPNTDAAVIKETKHLGLVSIPGAYTPSEVVFAHQCGADVVKLFPAGILGAAYIKALKAPLKHIPMMAVGGVTPQNTPDFLTAGAVGVGVGGNLVSPKLVAERRFEEIAAIARQYADAVRG